ncbi:MAG: HEAT repeat domain-containing protein, partial [Candidatus Electrothrix sp. EH2]|nr:HEAT repeat domain-containing protein [Candidatus Electrothrix sp. EH2]
EALGMLGDSSVAPELVKLLADEDVSVQSSAAGALGELGDSSVAPELVKRLKDKDASVRSSAVYNLGELGDSSVVSDLVPLLADEDADVRWFAAYALAILGDSSVAPELVKRLKDKDASVRSSAADNLGELGDRSVVRDLVPLLADEDAYVRSSAARALGMLGDSSVARDLVPLLADEDAGVRSSAANNLGELGDRSVVRDLVPLLADEDESVRSFAARALGMLGDNSVVRVLVPLLTDEEVGVRLFAVKALGMLGDRSVVRDLVPLLADEYASVRNFAVEALGMLGDSSVAPELVKLIADAYSSGVMEALVRLKAKVDASIIRRYLENTELRDVEAKALLRMNISMPELRTWQEEQFKAAQNELKQQEKEEAAAALNFVFTKEAVTLLSTLLTDPNQNVVEAAVESIGSIGEYHPGLVQGQAEQLLSLTAHINFNIRRSAMTALGQIISFQGKEPPANLSALESKVNPVLRKILFNQKEELIIRQAALDALGATRRRDCAKEIYELLKTLNKDKDESGLDESLRYPCVSWLGRMAYSEAQDYVENELEELEQEKATWREQRDSEQQEKIDSSTELVADRQDKTWKKEHWEYMLGNALARIAPAKRGIDLLNHPLYQVRQGAIRALASRIADGAADATLIGKIIQAHQNFDPDDLPSPFPYAAFQAIDLALWNLEYTGKKDDVSKLKNILKNLKPCQVPGQEGAIKERLEWTIQQLKENLARNEK